MKVLAGGAEINWPSTAARARIGHGLVTESPRQGRTGQHYWDFLRLEYGL
jgi:hypothetical protein